MAKLVVDVGAGGQTRIVEPTPEDLAQREQHMLTRRIPIRQQQSKMVKAIADRERKKLDPDGGAIRALAMVNNKRGRGQIPSQAELNNEQSALNALAMIEAISLREQELLAAVAQDKKILGPDGIPDGSIDGVGSWTTPTI